MSVGVESGCGFGWDCGGVDCGFGCGGEDCENVSENGRVNGNEILSENQLGSGSENVEVLLGRLILLLLGSPGPTF